MTVIRIASTAQLIAYVSHALGFTPHESAVFIPDGHRRPTARVDLPTTVEGVLTVAEGLGTAYMSSLDITPGTTSGGQARSMVLIANTHHTTSATRRTRRTRGRTGPGRAHGAEPHRDRGGRGPVGCHRRR